jgi:hypothetical protein
MNRRWTQIHADNQRVVLIEWLTHRVRVHFFINLLTLTSICVHLRFILLFRFSHLCDICGGLPGGEAAV